MKLDR